MKNIANNKLRMYFYGKGKKYTVSELATATQRVLHLPVTRIFDMRTLIVLNNLKENKYNSLKTLVNSELSKVH